MPLTFSNSRLKELCEQFGILGALLGTLPCAIHQNYFRGLPALLSAEEWNFLSQMDRMESDVGEYSLHQLLLNLFSNFWNAQPQEGKNQMEYLQIFGDFLKNYCFEPNDALKSWDLRGLLKTLSFRLPDGMDERLMGSRVEIPTQYCLKYISVAENGLLGCDDSELTLSATSFNRLKSLDSTTGPPFLLPGTKFGGQWCLYPSYPARFHSNAIVHLVDDGKNFDGKDEDPPTKLTYRSLVQWGRIASGTRKTALIIDQRPKKDCRHFSMEWTGW